MSKTRLLLLFLTLPLFLAGVYVLGTYVKQKSAKAITGPNIISPTPFLNGNTQANAAETALLTKESGEVQYKLPEATEFKKLETDSVSVPTGTSVKTGNESLAHVVFPNNSLMSLSKDTEVVLNFEEKKINIFQTLGNTWHRVEKVLQGDSYTVETANTLATVRGTEFNVGFLPDGGTELYVMESVVDYSTIEKQNGEMKIKETKKVEKDKHVFLKKADAAKPMQVVDLPANKKNTAWFKRNSKITEEIKKAEKEAELTATPANGEKPDVTRLDVMKHVVREKIMEEIKNDKVLEKELKTIDDTFRVEPTKTSDKSDGTVRGTSTAIKDVVKEDKKEDKSNDTPLPIVRNVENVISNVSPPVDTNPSNLDTNVSETLGNNLPGVLAPRTSPDPPPRNPLVPNLGNGLNLTGN